MSTLCSQTLFASQGNLIADQLGWQLCKQDRGWLSAGCRSGARSRTQSEALRFPALLGSTRSSFKSTRTALTAFLCAAALRRTVPHTPHHIASSSSGEDRRMMAARCLGELVRKMGERVLARIIPILRQGVHDDSPSTRQGVVLGLKEVRTVLCCAALVHCVVLRCDAMRGAVLRAHGVAGNAVRPRWSWACSGGRQGVWGQCQPATPYNLVPLCRLGWRSWHAAPPS